MSVPGSNNKSAKTTAPGKSKQPEEAMPLNDLISTVPAGQQMENEVLDHVVEAMEDGRRNMGATFRMLTSSTFSVC
ncbi:MAG: hypothetical protein FRX49_05191 [Trebouxia sp. A1-2]|nr:MAG: hypothetical protein FRX49_05191 [Trebouxia sp. A1-2]